MSQGVYPWLEVPGPDGSLYKVTDSFFMQEPVFLGLARTFNGYLIANNLKNDRSDIRFLDGHASHINLEVL